jgi:hypothetical protein
MGMSLRCLTTINELFLPRSPHDTPYRDDPSPDAAKPARPSSQSPRESASPRKSSGSRNRSAAKSAQKPAGRSVAKAAVAPRTGTKHTTSIHASAKRPAASPASSHNGATKPARKRSGRRRGRGGGSTGENQLTSTPTSRNAYVETRVWLLAQHGPVCAYCGRRFTARVMTLDHVAPRRGQTAYDRRDNLVLACPGCNAAKRDLAPLAFLLGARLRAANLLRYGGHLSPMLLDMATSLAPADSGAAVVAEDIGPDPWDLIDDDGESPYRD